jgi:hypothetical protein
MRFALLLLLLTGCAGPGTREVVAIPKTHSYHTSRCPKVVMARTVAMTIEEARSLHLSACPGCRPGEGGAL